MTSSSTFYLFSLKATVCCMLFMSFAADHLRSIWGANIVVFKLGPPCMMLFLITNTRSSCVTLDGSVWGPS